MAITYHGLRRAFKRKGATRQGTKIYLVESDSPIGDGIDPIIEHASIPDYYDAWDATTDPYLRVATKSANAHDTEEGAQEGYYWEVTVTYEQYNTETSDDPTDWDWMWSKNSVQRKRAITTSQHDISDYVAPGKDAADMAYRNAGEPLTNTADQMVDIGAFTTTQALEISLTKYLESSKWDTDIGVASSHALDLFVGSTNDGTVDLLGHTYDKFELEMSQVSYQPVVKNGYDVIELKLKITADEVAKHVLAYVSRGKRQKSEDGSEMVDIYSGADGSKPTELQPLDQDGRYIPLTGGAAVRDVVVIAAGDHPLEDWSGLKLPGTE